MAKLWTVDGHVFNSRRSAVLRSVVLGRDQWREQAREARRQVKRLTTQLDDVQQAADVQIANLKTCITELEQEIHDFKDLPVQPPCDIPLKGHQFGLKLMSWAIDTAKISGLRAAPEVMRASCHFFGCPLRIPEWSAIRIWLIRAGIGCLEEPIEPAGDWIWFIDHSNQIGQEKVLVVLGIRQSKLPPVGTPLKHSDLRVLEVLPGVSWKTEDVGNALLNLAARAGGAPRAVLGDGAAELRDGAAMLKTLRDDCVFVSDFKHFAANVLKRELERDERFKKFTTLIGQVRSSIQQTELAPLIPSSVKPKARFMNLAPQLRWAARMLWLLDHPTDECLAGITPDRLKEKLGGLEEFRQDIANWNALQDVISLGVTLAAENGLHEGVADEFAQRVSVLATAMVASADSPAEPASPEGVTFTIDREQVAAKAGRVSAQLQEFLAGQEKLLKPGERLPLSTEILESSFGLYKQLEGQHSKYGFTGLLGAFGGLLRDLTPEELGKCLTRVNVAAMLDWQKKKLRQTFTSRRRAVTIAHRRATKSNIKT